ncbi:hypothetical protein ACFLZW_01150 [Chloroflexota bacterium]
MTEAFKQCTVYKGILLCIFFLTTLGACAPLTKSEQPHFENPVILDNQNSIGQTFVARYDGLQSISLYLQPGSGSQGSLNLNLRARPSETEDQAFVSMDIASITTPGYYAFTFPIQHNSTQRYYYMLVTLTGEGNIAVGASHADAYLNGALYQNGNPLDAQAAFQLGYDKSQALIGLIREAVSWSTWLVVGLILFIVPGWALLLYTYPGWGQLHWAEKLGLAGGVSLATYPVMLLWTGLVGLELGTVYGWLPALTGFLAIVLNKRKAIASLPTAIRLQPKKISSSLTWADIALWVTIILIFATRFWAARGLEAPMWGDSYQHTVIAQLIVDNGGLFSSWQPYADMTTFTYHFGFHSLVAAFHWITRLPMHQSVLWVGQILNALAILFLIPLVRRLNKNPWSGVATLVLAGLLLPMPMYYLNWGRYTQLAALAILPAAICLSWAGLEGERLPWRKHFPIWIVFAGLALTHVRVLVFALFFYCAYFLLNSRWHSWTNYLTRIIKAGMGAGILFLPWFTHIFSGRVPQMFGGILQATAAQLKSSQKVFEPLGDLFFYLPPLVWLILPICLVYRAWRKDKGVLIIGLWWFLIFLSANPHFLGLPGTGLMTNFAVFIAAYIPAAIILGAAAGALVDDWKQATVPEKFSVWKKRLQRLLPSSMLMLTLLAGIWGARQRLWDINPPAHALVTRPDLQAFEWIRKNIPEETLFLVNTRLAFGNSTVVGTDAGWWLPLLAERQTTLPPINYGFEQGSGPNYWGQTNFLTKKIIADGINSPTVQALLAEKGVTHIYIGQRNGSINNPNPLITPQQFLKLAPYTLIYHQDQVWIFHLRTK